MKLGYVTNNSIVDDLLTEIDITGQIKEEVIKRQIDDAAKMIIDTEQMMFGVSILDVENFHATLPDGLATIELAACTDNPKHYLNREEVAGWRQQVFGTECQVEVNLLCPECKKDKCKHSAPVIEVDVDRLYIESRPYLWNIDSKYLGYSAAITDGFPTPNFSPHFQIMKPRASDAAFWNSEYFLGICNSLDTVKYLYDRNGQEFLTNLKEGQVYIAYLKFMKDSEGYFMIPDNPIAIEAVKAFVTMKMMRKHYLKDGNQTDRLRYKDMQAEAMQLISQAKVELETPEAGKFNRIADKHYRIPRDRYYYG